jgi:hypothetical protein
MYRENDYGKAIAKVTEFFSNVNSNNSKVRINSMVQDLPRAIDSS